MKRESIVVVALVIAFQLPLSASAADIDELMQVSGISKQMTQLEPQVRLAFEQQAKSMDGATATQVKQAIGNAYDATKLQRKMRRELERAMPKGDIDPVVAFLKSPLGRRVTQLEEAAGEGDAAAAFPTVAPKLVEGLGAPRRALLERLLSSTHAAEAMATAAVETGVGVAEGLAMADPSIDKPELLERVRGRLKVYIEQSKPQALAWFAYAYRSLSDAELADYAAFYETPPGQRYEDAVLKALKLTLAEAAASIGRGLAQPRSKS